MPHGPDSIEQTYVDYLDQSRQYSDELAQTQALVDTGQFTGADTGIGAPEMQPSPLSKGAPVGTYAPPTKVPPLPTNLEELKNFTGWNEPGFLEGLFGMKGNVASTVDTTLKAVNAPFEALYNLIQNVPVKTEGDQAARESIAKLAYIGSMFTVPADLGVLKGLKVVNTAARGTKLAEKVATRAAEIVGGSPVAPATFAHIQEGFGNIAASPMFTMAEDIAGHPKGSTVSSQTLKEAGFSVPPVPESVGAAAAVNPAEALAPPAKGTIKLGRNAVGEGERGFIARTGEDILASPEGHQFTDSPAGSIRYRLLAGGSGELDRAFFDIPGPLDPKQYRGILLKSKGAGEIILDLPTAPERVHSSSELRAALAPYVEKTSDELAPLIAKAHAENGGSTFSLTGKNLAGTEGYAVSTFKNLEKVLDHAPSEAEVKAYIDSLPEALQQNLSKGKSFVRPNISIGTWEDGGKHYLDVSRVVQNYDQAMTLAVNNQQKAIFDLKNMKTISVEAQGFPGAAASGYENVPDSLLGFGKKGGQAFAESKYPHEQPVRVTLPGGDVFEDSVRGMNPQQALERARRNWPGASIELLPPVGEGPGAAASKLAPGGTVQMNRAIERSGESLPSLQKATDAGDDGARGGDLNMGLLPKGNE